MTFGERFKKLRIEKNLKQQELVDDFNKIYGYTFNKSSISQYENNKRKPETDALIDFALYFNVSVDYLLGVSNIKNTSSKFIQCDLSTKILNFTTNFFMDDKISRNDKDMFFKKISELYFESLNVK